MRKRISVKLARYGVVAALLLGLAMSTVQILRDLANEGEKLTSIVGSIIEMARPPAVAAARLLDDTQAAQIVDGLMTHDFIVEARLVSDLGEVLASRTAATADSTVHRLTRYVSGDVARHAVALIDTARGNAFYGELVIVVDPGLALADFFERSWFIVGGGVLRNLVLALVLFGIFHWMLTKPLVNLIEGFRRVDPRNPGGQRLSVGTRHVDDELGLLAEVGNDYFSASQHHLKIRGETEAALRESEARFRAITETSPVPLVITRRSDGKILYANPKVGPAFGLAAGEIVGRFITEFYWDSSGRKERLAVLDKDGYVRDDEVEMRKADGSPISTIHSLQVIEYQGEQAVLGGFYDITERKRVEEALHNSEERLRRAILNAPIPIMLHTEPGEVLMISKQWTNVTGYTHEEIPTIDEWTKRAYGGKPPIIVEALDKAYADNVDVGTFVVTTASGEKRIWTFYSSQLGATAKGDVLLITTVQDITERKTAEAEQRKAEDALRQAQKMEAVGQLTGGLAHDFNNLMAIMLINAELLKDGIGEDEEAKECIEAIMAAVDRGSSLTGRLLAFSRQQALSPVATDVSELIGGLHDMLQRTLGETIELKVEGTPDLWPATIDRHQFDNALVNLAINARDAMPRGGTLVIETANATLDRTYAEQHDEVTPGDYVMVAVSDSGTGMPPEVLEKVFEPFFTTKEMGKGSGLGLSMVYGFMKQSKGHITIYSEVDHGTTVKLYMPRSQEGVAKTDAKDDAVEFARGSERILVVEDDPAVRKGPVKILRGHGYEVVEAGNGEEAIEHLKTGQPFDLLFTDVVLPGGMNGVEIAEQAKRLQPNIKVLYATGYAENAVVHSGRLDPGVTLVNKPYRRAELLEKVRAILDSEGD